MRNEGKLWFSELFKLLENNKNYPKYQFERRADIFINHFLKDILKEKFCDDFNVIVPEFPLLYVANSHRCSNMDYLAISKSKQKIIIIELKTDGGSLTDYQVSNYKKVKENSLEWWKGVTDKIIARAARGTFKRKFEFLLSAISENNQVITPSIFEVLFIAPDDSESYIKSKDVGFHFISFEKEWAKIKTKLIQAEQE